MKKRYKNIYMGPDSTAKLPVFGKVNTSNEIRLNIIATAYDSLNNTMLTRKAGVFDQTTLKKINGRFSTLRLLSRKHAPTELMLTDQIYKIVADHFKNIISDAQALASLQNICMRYNVDPFLLNIAMFHVNQAEMQDPFGINMFMIGNNASKNRKGEFR